MKRANLCRRLGWQDLDRSYLKQLIATARREDLEGLGLASAPPMTGDLSTVSLPLGLDGTASLVARSALVVCGLPLIPLVLEVYGGRCHCQPKTEDGQAVEKGTSLATVSGATSHLLQAERILLNLLQHLSGIATQTARYVAALGMSHTRILDTRKTTPGFRVLEKYAVACGGGWNHRIGLFDRIMLKDNHLTVCSEFLQKGTIEVTIQKVRDQYPDHIVEVEVDTLEPIEAVIKAGADVILLDNFSIEALQQAVALVNGRVYLEASGGIILATLPKLATLGIDFISCGGLTHQSTWSDIGVDWDLR